MVTEDEWSGEVAKSARFRLISPIIALGAFGLIFIPCMMAGQALASGIYADLVAVGILLGIMFPLAFVLVVMGEKNQRRTDEKVRDLNAELSAAVADAERLNNELSEAMSDADRQAEIRDAQVQRQRFESRLANALDMAEGEPEVIEVIERSFATVLPDAPGRTAPGRQQPRAPPPHGGRRVPRGSRRAAAWIRPTVARRHAGRRSRSSPTATTSTPARSCATAPRAASRRSAYPCPSWGARWA